MAKYDVERSCGHEETITLFGPGKERERRLEWEATRSCSECFKEESEAAREKKKSEDFAKATEIAKDFDLPVLTGTVKQIQWAETLRAAKVETIFKVKSGDVTIRNCNFTSIWGSIADNSVMSPDDPNLDHAISLFCDQTSSHWWIDNRERKIGFILRELFDKNPPQAENLPEIKEAMIMALAEATLRPETPLTETVADIRIHEKSVEIIFPEKRNDFWEIIKKQLNYQWCNPSWQRFITPTNGTPADRAAEAGNMLLSAGFIVRISDPAVREKAVTGAYDPETVKWIYTTSSGVYTGWFLIVWDKFGDSYYDVAKRIKGAKYAKPWVAVPPDQFENILGFAETHGFKLTNAAQKIVEQARQIKEASLLTVPAKTKRKKITSEISNIPEELEVPEAVEIADEFLDEI